MAYRQGALLISDVHEKKEPEARLYVDQILKLFLSANAKRARRDHEIKKR